MRSEGTGHSETREQEMEILHDLTCDNKGAGLLLW